MRYLITLSLLVILQTSFAQTFNYEAVLNTVDSSAYYKVKLEPTIYNKLSKNVSDIRIYDSKNNEIPFLWEEEYCGDKEKKDTFKLENVNLIQQDSKERKKSVITIKLPYPTRVTELSFKISSPLHYKRSAKISYVNLDNRSKKKRKQKEHYLIEFRSDKPRVVSLPESKVQTMVLEIDNEDNLPLKFAKVDVLQRDHFIIAYLEKGKLYTIRFGSSRVPFPNYDITYFKKSIPKSPAVVEVEKISRKAKENNATSVAFYKDKNIIWIAIIIAIGIVGLVSFRMIKEISNK